MHLALYQNTVLQADLDVENGIVTFLQAQESVANLRESVDEAWIALEVIVAQYEAGLAGIDFNRYATIQQTLVTQQDLWAQSRGQIGQGLIQVYRGLGGGWQIRLGPPPDQRGVLSRLPPPTEEVRPPAPMQIPPPVNPNGEPLPAPPRNAPPAAAPAAPAPPAANAPAAAPPIAPPAAAPGPQL